MRRFFAADGKKHARCDDGGLRVAVDVDTLALVALALLSFESVFCISIFDHLIVDDCLPLVDLSVVRLGEGDDRYGQAEVAALFFNDREALQRRVRCSCAGMQQATSALHCLHFNVKC